MSICVRFKLSTIERALSQESSVNFHRLSMQWYLGLADTIPHMPLVIRKAT